MWKPLIHTHCHLICYVSIKGHVSMHIVWCWRCWDTCIQKIKAMLKLSKIYYIVKGFQCIKCYVCQRWCLWLLHNTAHRVLLSITHVKGIKYYVLYSVYKVSHSSKGEGYLFEKPSTLWVKLLTTSQFEEAALLTFLDFQLQGWLQARRTANHQFLKLRGCSATR